jgi:hypothetical protein
MLSVKLSQPKPAWELGRPLLTVKVLFNNKTPCSAQSDKFPLFLFIPKSSLSSLNILINDLGNETLLFTLKDNPFA